MIDDTGKDPWPERVAQGEGHWRELIDRGTFIDGVMYFGDVDLADHFSLPVEKPRPIITHCAELWHDPVKTMGPAQLLTFQQIALLIGWPLNGGRRRNAVAEAMLCYHSDFFGKLITNPPKDAATTIAQQNLAEAAHNVSPDFCRLLFAHRRNGAPGDAL
jgi:hypothetical protein